MANKLPNEQELLQQLRDEKVSISMGAWDEIYAAIEDKIQVIKLIAILYQEQDKDIPLGEAKKILAHIQDVAAVFRKLINPKIIKTEDKGLVKIKSEGGDKLHPIIREMVTHYIGNDIQALNFMLGDTIDDGNDLDPALREKITRHVADMEEFLIKLKESTTV